MNPLRVEYGHRRSQHLRLICTSSGKRHQYDRISVDPHPPAHKAEETLKAEPAPLREQEVVIRLCQLDLGRENYENLASLFDSPLDWNYIVVTAARHKVLQLLWRNMREYDLIQPATSRGGLTDLWLHYMSQLYTMNHRRNCLYLENAEHIAVGLADLGVRFAVLKGGALIGTLYPADCRFLNDIDLLILRQSAAAVKEYFLSNGYEYGHYDYAAGKIQPISEDVRRAWLFHNHTLPTFFKPSDNSDCLYYKVQAGFDFFDPFEDYSVNVNEVLDRTTPKAAGSSIMVPAPVDMLTNLCCHIYREGVSTVYNDYNVNWQMTKFCDVLSFLRAHDGPELRESFARVVDGTGLEFPVFYAFYHADQVYRDPQTAWWADRFDTGDHDRLNELRDGRRRIKVTEPFRDRLFSLARVEAIRSLVGAGTSTRVNGNQEREAQMRPSSNDVAKFRQHGFIHGIWVENEANAIAIQRQCDDIRGGEQYNRHLDTEFVWKLVSNERILDWVESLLGPIWRCLALDSSLRNRPATTSSAGTRMPTVGD